MPTAAYAPVTLKELSFDVALHHLDEGAAFVDLRTPDEYLDVHVPGSLDLVFEFGPGMPSRARDCIPLSVPLILLEDNTHDLKHVAASLRGKGFSVVGFVRDGINSWAAAHGRPASTEIDESLEPPSGLVLDVADPGANAPAGSLRISAEELWRRSGELADERPVVIAAGYGVRAALAVGILELAGVREPIFWRTPRRPRG
ncbi:MAG: rhodanese-like domain-containing protein [Actinomycetota bacterium]|nr:rhodanese-like domain-containing protein [Actinomycetota bacterium]